MELTSPRPFVDALRSLGRRQIMPTNLGSAALSKLDADLLRNSFFSARTLFEDLLDSYKADITRMLNPQRVTRVTEDGTKVVTEGLNLAKAREDAKLLLQRMGYQPDPEMRGTIQDLSSDARINLVLNVNKQTAQGEGAWIEGQDPVILDAWPGQELFRAVQSRVKRPWLERWRTAGQATGDPIGTGWTVMPEGERMIALKNHAIWERLGDPNLFADGLGNPWPPFAFNSGMDVRDVRREVVEELGLIDRGEQVRAKSVAELAA